MQILADEWISLTCFYYLSIAFPSLGKKCLIRPKTCRKIKIRNAWGYKRIGLWTVGIQISKVKNQLELLCTKKIRHNVFNLSSGGSVTWIVNFLSDVLSSLANPTDHRQCESEDKSENEVFVTWPRNRSVMWLCTRQHLNLSTHPAKFGGHRTCGWGNIAFSNCHVTTELKCLMTFWDPFMMSKHATKFGVGKSCESGDIPFFICHMTTWSMCHVTLWVGSPHFKSPPC